METTSIVEINSGIATTTPKLKTPKRRFCKSTNAASIGLPGANTNSEKKVEPGVIYSLCFSIPVTGPVGSVTEASQGYDFTYQLDVQAKAKDVGAVTTVNASNGNFEVVLKLTTTSEPDSHDAPASNAVAQLKDFLTTAPQLIRGPAGKPATWKAKANGTTIASGSY